MKKELSINKNKNKINEFKKLTETLYTFQNSLFDLTNDITNGDDKTKTIANDNSEEILKFYGMLDDFVMNIESLKMEMGEFYFNKNSC